MHTKFNPTNYVFAEIEAMRKTETGFAIHFLPFDQIHWSVGCYPTPDGVFAGEGPSGSADTLEEALVDMCNAARTDGKASQANGAYFSNCDIKLIEDQRSIEDLTAELGNVASSFELSYDTGSLDPYYFRWILTVGDRSYGGYTAIEAIKFALSSETGINS